MTEQSKIGSAVETTVNIFIGFSINYVMGLILLPMFFPEIHITLATNFWLGVVYTVVSVIRQYTIRRWFNYYIHRGSAAASRYVEKLRAKYEERRASISILWHNFVSRDDD